MGVMKDLGIFFNESLGDAQEILMSILRRTTTRANPWCRQAHPDPEPAYQLAERLIAEDSPEAAASAGISAGLERAPCVLE